jgi:hypothetical protein
MHMTRLVNTLLAHALLCLEQGVENVCEPTPEAYRRRKRRNSNAPGSGPPAALSAIEKAEQLSAEFLDRHVNGD